MTSMISFQLIVNNYLLLNKKKYIFPNTEIGGSFVFVKEYNIVTESAMKIFCTLAIICTVKLNSQF